jgi:hypothetical protein
MSQLVASKEIVVIKTDFSKTWDIFHNNRRTPLKTSSCSDMVTLWLANETCNYPNLELAWQAARHLVSRLIITD